MIFYISPASLTDNNCSSLPDKHKNGNGNGIEIRWKPLRVVEVYFDSKEY